MTDKKDLQVLIANLSSELAKDSKSTVFVRLADAYRQAGQLDDALEVALRGTWELPEHAPGYAAVGRIYMQRKVLSKAATAFQKAIEADPNCLDAYKGMARLRHDQGELKVAAEIVQKALALAPDDATLKQMASSLPQVSGAAGGAAGITSTVSSSAAPVTGHHGGGAMKPITTATIAEIYMEQGLYGQALEVYRGLLVEAPNDPALKQKIADIELLARGEVPASMQPPEPVKTIETTSQPQQPQPLPGAASENRGSVLETLEGWLNAIQVRRNGV